MRTDPEPLVRQPGSRRNGPGPLRVALLGGFGVGNLGNDASLEAVIHLVRRVDADALITCLCPNPAVVRERHDIPAYEIRSRRLAGRLSNSPVGRLLRLPSRLADMSRAVRFAGSVDALLVPGTGILDDYGGERPTGWPMTLAVWLGAARARGACTGLVSVGAGPLAHRASRRLARLIGGLAQYRSFRDPGSRNFMVSTGLDVPVDEVVPDIVFSLPVPVQTPSRSERPLVAVPVMKYRGWYAEQRSAAIADHHVDNFSEFCSWLLQEGYAVRLVTADSGDGPATRRVAEQVRAATPELARSWLTTADADDLHGLMRLLSDATAVVATRYHSVIGALLCGKPTISIGYAAKNDELMAAVGLGAYCQHVERVDQDGLRRQFTELMTEHDRLSLEVTARVAAFRRRLAQEEDRLRALVLSPTRRSG